MKTEVSSDVLAEKELAKAIVSGKREPEEKAVQTGRAYIRIFKAVGKVEPMAFYGGH